MQHSPSKDAFTHQIWDSYLKEYMKYAPDTTWDGRAQLSKNRSEVKVTVTRKWYATSAIRGCIHTPNLGFLSQRIKDMCIGHEAGRTEGTLILKTSSEVKVTLTRKLYATPRHPKMHPHTKCGNMASNNMGDMHRTRSGTDYFMPPEVPMGHKNRDILCGVSCRYLYCIEYFFNLDTYHKGLDKPLHSQTYIYFSCRLWIFK